MNAAQIFVCDLLDDLAMPVVYQRLRQLLTSETPVIQAYIEVIEEDTVLVDWIVQLANSQYFGYPRKANDLDEAIRLLGLIQLQDLLLCHLCMRSFSQVPDAIIDMQQFWSCSVDRAIAARTIAFEYRFPAGARFFSLGLLCEIGHAVMFLKAPESLLQAIEESQTTGYPMDRQEKYSLGFDYTDVGVVVMKSWQLPQIYLETVTHHLQPELAQSAFQKSAAIVGLAHCLIQHPDFLVKSQAMQRHLALLDWQTASLHELQTCVNRDIKRFKQEIMDVLMPLGPALTLPTSLSEAFHRVLAS